MNPKTFIGWAAAAVIFAIAAVATTVNRPDISVVDLENEPAFPEIGAKANDISKVTISSAEGSFSLIRRDGGEWVAPDKFNYPVASKKVRDLIVAMADMKLVEPKTTREDRFPRLGVESIDAEDSNACLVRIESAGEGVISEVIVGENRYRLTGSRESGTYIRRPDEQQAWLASGRVSVDEDLIDWLDRGIMNVDADNLRRISFAPQDGLAYSAERTDKDDQFQIADVPEGRNVNQNKTGSLATLFGNIEFADVKPRSDFVMPEQRNITEVETFDGVVVSVEFAKIDDLNWAVLSARYVGDPADSSDNAKAARDRATEINSRSANWAYQIPDYIAARLNKPIEDILAAKEKTS